MPSQKPKLTSGGKGTGNFGSDPVIRWCQVAGYFDGDGSVEPKFQIFTIGFGLTWTDSYRKQLLHLRRFLKRQGIHTTKVRSSKSILGRPVWHLSAWGRLDVIETCMKMIPHLDKKRIQGMTAMKYLEGRLTGTNVVNTFNAECRQGRWSGKLRDLDLPLTRDEGRELAQLNANDPRNRKYSSSGRDS